MPCFTPKRMIQYRTTVTRRAGKTMATMDATIEIKIPPNK